MMANPFGMAEFSVPQLIGVDMQMKQSRLEEMYRRQQMDLLKRQSDREDKKAGREDKMYEAYDSAFGHHDPAAPASPGAAPGAPTNLLPDSSLAPSPAGEAPQAAAPSSMQPAAPVTASSFRPDPTKLDALRATGPDGFKAAAEIEKMGADRLQAAQESMARLMELKGRVINGVRARPPAEREAAYQAERQQLVASGADPSTLPPHWDEHVADQLIDASLKTAEALNMHMEAQKFAHQVKHDTFMENNAAANTGIAAGHLAISARADARAANAPAGVYPVQSKADYDGLPHGTHYSAPDGTVRIKP